ncbi:MAG: DUF4058 family protein [Aggregatilineales bacterium]
MTLTNPYRGVNAHLNSWLQQDDRWRDFHTVYLAYLRNALAQALTTRGYRVTVERSIQLRLDLPTRPKQPDMLIVDPQERPTHPRAYVAPASAQVVDLHELLLPDDPEDEPSALAVYHASGRVVLWFELLSPINESQSSGFDVYNLKRRQILQSDIAFVELDLLHEQPPAYRQLSTVTPFRLVVIPPAWDKPRQTWLFHFDVDDAIPSPDVPIITGDTITLPLDEVYQRVFVESAYGADLDYRQLPLHIERYPAASQSRIQAVMHRVQ